MSIRNHLSATGDVVELIEVERYIQKRYIKNNEEIARRDAARQRKLLYNCGGVEAALSLIAKIFQDPNVQKLRQQLAPLARFDNALRRIVNERARVYAKRARVRRVDNGTDERYQDLQRRTNHDFAFRTANQYVSLMNDCWVQFRVRDTPSGEREPRIDVVGPDDFYAIAHPTDPTLLLGIILDQTPQTTNPRATDPHYLVYTVDERFKLDSNGHVIDDTFESNPFGRLPGVLIHGSFRTGALLDSMTGEDIVAAHLAAWLLNTLLLKESKSLNRQGVFTGETGNSPTGQSQDTERDLILAEGVGFGTIDRGVDLNSFMNAANHVIEHAAANYGIPPALLRLEGASSGYELELRRVSLEEHREDQVVIFRDAEREFAKIQAEVLKVDMPELAFDTAGWWIDFSEVKRPESDRDRYETRKLKRSMGHSDPVVEAMEDNPDFDPDQAAEWVLERMEVQAAFEEARAIRNMPSNPTAPAQTPEENGAMSQDGEDEPGTGNGMSA